MAVVRGVEGRLRTPSKPRNGGGPPGAEQTRMESWYFSRIARDFGYVTRPAAQGYVDIDIANFGVVAVYGCYYPRIYPINKAPGVSGNFSEQDMLVLCTIISHLGLMYLKVADWRA